MQQSIEAFMLQCSAENYQLFFRFSLKIGAMHHFNPSSKSHQILLVLILLCSAPAMASANDAGKLVSRFGEVMVSADKVESWRPVKSGEKLQAGTVIRTGRLSGASLLLQDESLIRLSQNTRFEIKTVKANSYWQDADSVADTIKAGLLTSFRLLSGKLWGRNNNTDVNAEISTLTATFGVRGTEFTIEASDSNSTLTVHEGTVLAKGVSSEVSVKPGEQAVVPLGKMPQKSAVENPRSSVQWTVEVPELLHLRPYLKSHVDNKVAASGIYQAMKKKITPRL